MRGDRMTIGEMARLNNISVQALRLYSRMGLIEPMLVDSDTGYRYYDINQSQVLDTIGYLKSMGMSLKAIKGWFDEPDLDAIKAELLNHHAAFAAEIRRLELARASIGRLAARIDRIKNRPPAMVPMVEEQPSREVHQYEVETLSSTSTQADFERVMRGMKAWLVAAGLPVSYFARICGRVRLEDFLGTDPHLSSLYIVADDYSSQVLPVETIPAGRYLTVYFATVADEPEAMASLRAALTDQQLTAIGDYVSETIFEYPTFPRAERRESLFSGQIRVQPAS